MSLTLRETPAGTVPIGFCFKDAQDWGMVNLGPGWEQEVSQLKDTDKIVIPHELIYIHFPMFDHFFVQMRTSIGGFTLSKLIASIVQVGTEAGHYDTTYHPEHYRGPANRGPATAEDFLGEYAITAGHGKSDIQLKGKNVFVSVQH